MITVDEDGPFTPAEQSQIEKVRRSLIWRLIQDALCLERERILQRMPNPDAPGADRRLWQREGELAQVRRLLREGPNLVVYYDRHRRDEVEKRQAGESRDEKETHGIGGEPPTDLESV